MGNMASKTCGGEGVTKMLIKEYGDDVGRFIAVQKSKETVDTKVTEVKTKITSETDAIQSRCLDETTKRQKQMEDQFASTIKELDNKMFGGVSALEKLKGETVQEIVGLKALKGRFAEVKKNVLSKISEERSKALQQVDNAAAEGKRKIDAQKPKIPHYDKLPAAQQRLVFKEGHKLFKKQIAEQEANMIRELETTLNPETYIASLRNIAPTGTDDIMSTFQEKISSLSDI